MDSTWLLPYLSSPSGPTILQRENSKGGLPVSQIPFVSFLDASRIAKLELVDEYEELDLVLAHYALAWGLKMDKSSDPSLQRDLGVWGLHKYSNGEIVTETQVKA